MPGKAKMELVSVIVPVYNAGKYLEKCIQSILHQTFRDFEIILIDDGSTDNSWEICKEYGRTDLRIKAFHQENGGVSSARNLGLRNCRGKYVAFVDSDDYVKENYLECLWEDLQTNGADIAICNYWVKDNKGIRLACRFKNRRIASDSGISFCKNGLLFRVVWGKLFRRDILCGIFFDEKISLSEDCLFLAYALKHANHLFLESDPLYVYQTCGDSCPEKYGIGHVESSLSAWDQMAGLQEPGSVAYWSAKFGYLQHLRRVAHLDKHQQIRFREAFRKDRKAVWVVQFSLKEKALQFLLAYFPSFYFGLYRLKDSLAEKT